MVSEISGADTVAMAYGGRHTTLRDFAKQWVRMEIIPKIDQDSPSPQQAVSFVLPKDSMFYRLPAKVAAQ